VRRIRAAWRRSAHHLDGVLADDGGAPSAGSGVEQAVAIAREEPKALEAALEAIAHTLTQYARLALAAGADGLFYATNVARRGLLSAEECRRFQRPYDLRILEAVAAGPFTALHVCGPGVHFDEFVDYPAQAFSWALATAIRHFGRRIVGPVAR
jgi:uroporphyrinogen decarboxylase